MPEPYFYLRLHHIHSFIFQSRFHAHSCVYPPRFNLGFSNISRLKAHTSWGDCWRCCWRVASACFHTSSNLLAPKKKGQGKSTFTLWCITRDETSKYVSRLRIRLSQGIILTEFWFLDWNAPPPAQMEAQTFTNSFRSPLDDSIASPFREEGSSTPAHLGLSTFADRRRVQNDNFSGTTSGPSPLLSSARSTSDVASSSATNPTRVASPANDLSSGISVSSPPAYEAISPHLNKSYIAV